MLLDDGRMAFFDFGLFKRMPPGAVELEIEVARAVIEGDTETIMRLGTEIGFFPEPEKFDPERVLEHFRAATSWYTVDEDIELTPEYATQVLIDMSDPRSEYFGQLRHESAPPDHIFGRRMEVLTLAVISQLHARGNFHRIAREWFYGDDAGDRARRPGGRVLRPRRGVGHARPRGIRLQSRAQFLIVRARFPKGIRPHSAAPPTPLGAEFAPRVIAAARIASGGEPVSEISAPGLLRAGSEGCELACRTRPRPGCGERSSSSAERRGHCQCAAACAESEVQQFAHAAPRPRCSSGEPLVSVDETRAVRPDRVPARRGRGPSRAARLDASRPGLRRSIVRPAHR